MKIENYTAYKIVIVKTISQEERILYQVGKECPLRKWDINKLPDKQKEKALRFETVRQEINPNLPSRIQDNIFVFSNKDYNQRWCTILVGTLSEPYLLLTLSLTGDIKWFDAQYHQDNKPEKYWKSASDTPHTTPLNEGIFSGIAIIKNVKCIQVRSS